MTRPSSPSRPSDGPRHRRAAGRAAILALMLAAPAVQAAEPGPARREALRNLLVQDCGSCHGLTLKGGLGRPLTPDAVADRSAEALAAIILDGVPGTPMPPWRGLLTPEEALTIADIIKRGHIR
ncbi:c-type cytochrome [Prosthecomicrobium sp. N25]|uniref:c-type cytochrome n=1 Tax=Prosthecomicrobium sp. N25 TaxID=3129254 RepID=UPI0030772BED